MRSLSLESWPDLFCLRRSASGVCHVCAFLAFSSMASRNKHPRRSFFQRCSIRVSSKPSFIRAIRHSLDLPVLLLKLALHLEVDLTFTFDALLLHVTDHTLVHSLYRLSITLFTISSRIRVRGSTYGFVGDLLGVDEVHDSNGSHDGGCKCCLCFGRHTDF
jgi:hypothetical protein